MRYIMGSPGGCTGIGLEGENEGETSIHDTIHTFER
jgi:hypothetical protein